MITAFVMINTEVGGIEDVLKSLEKIPAVEEAYGVYGVYDIVSKVKAESTTTLKETVITRLRQVDKVRSTLTMIVMET